MNKKNFVFALAASVLSFTACKNNQSSQTEKTDQTSVTAPDMHTAQTSLDWDGTYFGVLPCASCPGINTLISLDDDGTFEKTVEYLDTDDTPETTSGKIEWKDGSIITIGESAYLVDENQLFALDANNKVIEGDLAAHYVLAKLDFDSEPQEKEGYYSMEYVDKDKNEYDVVFTTKPETPVAIVELDNDVKMALTQTEVWAKGAVYANKKAKLTAQGDKATLEMDGKKIELTEKK